MKEMTIEDFFKKVFKGQMTLADLIDEYREYQREYKMESYKLSLPDDADALKNTCTQLKFNLS